MKAFLKVLDKTWLTALGVAMKLNEQRKIYLGYYD